MARKRAENSIVEGDEPVQGDAASDEPDDPNPPRKSRKSIEEAVQDEVRKIAYGIKDVHQWFSKKCLLENNHSILKYIYVYFYKQNVIQFLPPRLTDRIIHHCQMVRRRKTASVKETATESSSFIGKPQADRARRMER